MTNQSVIAQTQAADLAGVSIRRLQQLAHEADAPPRDGDAYPCKAFGEWLRRRAIAGLGVSDDGRVYDYDAERARLTHHQANKTALEESLLQGKSIIAEEVERVWSNMIASFRARCLSIPTKAAQAVITTADIAEAESILTDAIHEALSELAEYDPQQYRRDASPQSSATSSATAEADSKSVGGRGKATKQRGKRGTRQVEH